MILLAFRAEMFRKQTDKSQQNWSSRDFYREEKTTTKGQFKALLVNPVLKKRINLNVEAVNQENFAWCRELEKLNLHFWHTM